MSHLLNYYCEIIWYIIGAVCCWGKYVGVTCFRNNLTIKHNINNRIMWFSIMIIILGCIFISCNYLLCVCVCLFVCFCLFFVCFFCIDNISTLELCWCCDELLDQIYGFTRICTVAITGDYIMIILMKPSWSKKCDKLMYHIILSIYEGKCVRYSEDETLILNTPCTFPRPFIFPVIKLIFSNVTVALSDNTKNAIFFITL